MSTLFKERRVKQAKKSSTGTNEILHQHANQSFFKYGEEEDAQAQVARTDATLIMSNPENNLVDPN